MIVVKFQELAQYPEYTLYSNYNYKDTAGVVGLYAKGPTSYYEQSGDRFGDPKSFTAIYLLPIVGTKGEPTFTGTTEEVSYRSSDRFVVYEENDLYYFKGYIDDALRTLCNK